MQEVGGSFEICSICGWEDDNAQYANPVSSGGANEQSLFCARRAIEGEQPRLRRAPTAAERAKRVRWSLDFDYVLRFESMTIGRVFDVSTDWPWEYGQVVLADAGREHRALFASMVDEDSGGIERVPASFLDERNWSVVRADGTVLGISVPAVHDDGVVAWRWRSRTTPRRR